jgi:L-alanine-DL-glutamate epimerase and related enzymes of enolase superfamily
MRIREDIPGRMRIVAAEVRFTRRPFLRPLRLSSGAITEITEAEATVTVERESGGAAVTGRGAIYLSDLWAWPDPSRPPAERDARMRAYCESVAATLTERTTRSDGVGVGLPLELGLRLHRSVVRGDAGSPLPPLARLVCASPLDAALHDAAGHAWGRSAFDLPVTGPFADAEDLTRLFVPDSPQNVLTALVRRPPAPRLDATLVVGKGDDLAELEPWVRVRGYRAFKLKVGGTDPREDARRVAAVYRHARTLGCAAPRLTVDANCASPDAATVGRFLDELAEGDAEAYAALEAVEQPTGRDIREFAFDWRPVAARKPVLLDEGLTDFDDLVLAREQGWNGMAVKTCRGHSFSLVAAAWAHRQGWKLTVMDLTNPGIAAVQSALLAAHLPGVDALEMNAAQYTPAANADLLPRLQTLLAPEDGTHQVPSPAPPGLGASL